MRWFITKKMLVLLIGALVAAMFIMALTSCIPVTIRPEFDDAGLPKAIPVAPVGSQDGAGVFHPPFAVSSEAPTPPQPFPWDTILQVGVALLTGAGGAGLLAGRVVGRVKTALSIACQLADDTATAETDEQVRLAKQLAESKQIRAGVHELTAQVRKK